MSYPSLQTIHLPVVTIVVEPWSGPGHLNRRALLDDGGPIQLTKRGIREEALMERQCRPIAVRHRRWPRKRLMYGYRRASDPEPPHSSGGRVRCVLKDLFYAFKTISSAP